MIWAYLGPPELEPPLPNFPHTQVPLEYVHTMKVKVACNWAQVIEGVIDSAHTNYLHRGTVRAVTADRKGSVDIGTVVERPSNDGAPKIEARNTNYGFRYAAIRKPTVDPDKNKYIRVTLWIAPFYSMFPASEGWAIMQGMLPIDDENTVFHYWRWRTDRPVTRQERDDIRAQSGFRLGLDVDPETWVLKADSSNNWRQDRAAMREGAWTGITGANLEDIAVEESMGPIYDRTKEHLGTSDIGVIRMRRLMLESARALAERGEPPIGLREPVALERLYADETMLPLDASWETLSPYGDLEPMPASS